MMELEGVNINDALTGESCSMDDRHWHSLYGMGI